MTRIRTLKFRSTILQMRILRNVWFWQLPDGEQPDLAIVDSSDIQYYDKAGILKDLSSEMKAENYLSRALISCRTKDGRLVGLPLGLQLPDILLQ